MRSTKRSAPSLAGFCSFAPELCRDSNPKVRGHRPPTANVRFPPITDIRHARRPLPRRMRRRVPAQGRDDGSFFLRTAVAGGGGGISLPPKPSHLARERDL